MANVSFGLQPRVCGEYMLVPHERWYVYQATREDGQPIPPRLQGSWTSFDDFRSAAETVHGDAYSAETIAAQQLALANQTEADNG